MLFDPDELRHIRPLLASHVPEDGLRLVIADSGLEDFRIELGRSLEFAWHSALEHAARQGPETVARVLTRAGERARALHNDPIFVAMLARARAGEGDIATSTPPTATLQVAGKTSVNRDDTPRPRVFLSHRTADRAEAEKLAVALEGRGIEVRLDTWEIGVGDSIVGWMNEALEDSAFVVLCYSGHGLNAPWVGVEWQAALTRQLNGKPIKILPVYLTGREGPAILDTYLAADWMKDPDGAVEGLVRAIFRRRRNVW